MPALIVSLLPLLGRVAPDLVGLAFGGQAQAVAARVEAALRDVFGTADPAQVQAAAEADPAKADALKVRLEAETGQLRAQLADVADARAMEAELVASGSRMAYGAPVVSVVATIGFVVAAVVVLLGGREVSAAGNQILGAMIVGWTTVLTYWLGSSKGSADKAAALGVIARRAGRGAPR